MRSSSAVRRRAQSGQSIVEALVAAALLGIGIVTGLTAVDTAQAGARQAAHQAWATCAVRAEAEAIEAHPWDATLQYQPLPHGINVTGTSTGSGQGQLQIIQVSAPGVSNATVTIYKAIALSTTTTGTNPSPIQVLPYRSQQTDGYAQWCEQLPGSGS